LSQFEKTAIVLAQGLGRQGAKGLLELLLILLNQGLLFGRGLALSFKSRLVFDGEFFKAGGSLAAQEKSGRETGCRA
jgi:hypothetical protein